MRVGVIDADLIGRKKHRFPNLCCMKISGYYKENGYAVSLLTDYKHVDEYDKVFISKVFTDTVVPDWVLNRGNVQYGGTGFFFDKAPDLPYEIEHHMPDYHLYDEFVNGLIEVGTKRNELKWYLDYSIGYITRGCFRKCEFCVNRKYDRAFEHSPLAEFHDETRPKICLLDDNFFSHPRRKELLEQLNVTGKPFTFKQGLDERLLTDEKCEMLCQAKYDGAITFAFDNIADYRMIEKKLQMLRRHTSKQFTFYVLVAFDRNDQYDDAFWTSDIADAFERIKLLMRYDCVPYIMRFEQYRNSPFKGIYTTLARWCNQPSFFKKLSFREFCLRTTDYGSKSAENYMNKFERQHPEIAKKYFDMKFEKEAE